MKIIDAHHHLWAPVSDPEQLGYVWLRDIGAPKPFGDPTPIQRDYLLDEFLQEPAPHTLLGSVHVQCDPKLPDPVAETAFIQRISDTYDHPIMIVGFADLAAGHFPQVVARHKEHANLRGLRQIISYLPDRPELSFASRNLLDDLIWQAHFATLADNGLSFDLQLYPEQMLQAAEFLSAHPNVPVVIDHLGSPYDSSTAGQKLWHAGMRALADLDHVHVKLGGYAMYFRGDLGEGPAHLTRTALEMFGAERVMFGSNFPVDGLHLSYDDLVRFVLVCIGDSAPQVMARTALTFYSFDNAAG